MAESSIYTNKLTIYMVRAEFSERDIIKDPLGTQKEDLPGLGRLYYKSTYQNPPKWASRFLGFGEEKIKKLRLIGSSAPTAVLIIESSGRIFAIAFGYGRSLMNQWTWERRFGLKTALGLIGPEDLRAIDKKNVSKTPKSSMEQLSKAGAIAEFSVEVNTDLLKGVAGKPKDGKFGKTIRGGDSLVLWVKIDITNIGGLLKEIHSEYESERYRANFGWIDNIAPVKDKKLTDYCDQELVEKIKTSDLERVWMAIPEIVIWENIDHFQFKKQSLGGDIDLKSYLNCLTKEQKERLSVAKLKGSHIDCVESRGGEIDRSWRIYDCMYCEVKHNDRIYILMDGDWYEINQNFAKTQSEQFDDNKNDGLAIKLALPNCEIDEREDNYNKRVAEEAAGVYCMDREMIYYGGSNQKVEFCDLITRQNNVIKIIHVKKYGNSAVLGHLFNQGFVSGELLQTKDPGFQELLKEKLPAELKPINEKPDSYRYQVIFVIISKHDKDLDIPFFSKVIFNETRKKLIGYGYEVAITKITQTPKKYHLHKPTESPGA